MSGQERRRYPRIDQTIRLRVGRGTEQLATETVNLSCGGALCWLKRPLPLMTKMAVSLALPDRLIHCTGAVVRCEAVRGRYRVALFFVDIRRQDHRAIAEFVLTSMLSRQRGHRRSSPP